MNRSFHGQVTSSSQKPKVKMQTARIRSVCLLSWAKRWGCWWVITWDVIWVTWSPPLGLQVQLVPCILHQSFFFRDSPILVIYVEDIWYILVCVCVPWVTIPFHEGALCTNLCRFPKAKSASTRPPLSYLPANGQDLRCCLTEWLQTPGKNRWPHF